MDILEMLGLQVPENAGTCEMSSTTWKVKTLNDQEGPGDCPSCKGKGYIAYERDGCLITRECRCERKRRSMLAMKRSGLSGMLENYTLEAYETPEPWQVKVKDMASRYIHEGPGKWFVVCGNPGTGKTHICTAICGAMIEAGKSVRYMLWRREAPKLKAEVNDRESYERDMARFRDAYVLYIDDFFKGGVTEADINLAFELLNDRYNGKGMTILSSEKSIEDILSIDEAIGSRIYERSKGYYAHLPARNWRLRDD